jgi:hypothetical protein
MTAFDWKKMALVNCLVGLAVWGSLDILTDTAHSASPCRKLACTSAPVNR